MSRAGEAIAVIGLWHQGVVGAACLADLGLTVRAADTDPERVRRLTAGEPPIYEPGLDDLLRRGLESGRLSFHDDPAAAVRGCSQVWVMHDTPVDEEDRPDVSVVLVDVERVAEGLEDGVVILVTAQVPVGTCAHIARIIARRRPGLDFAVGYWPENLRLGQAIERFRHPPLPVIGVDDDRALARLLGVLRRLHTEWHRCDVKTAEMLKHALNAYLATQIAFGNEIGNLCEALGADGRRLAQLLRLEPRIGPRAMLSPGLGFSGGTLARDTRTLIRLGDELKVETRLLDALWEANRSQLRLPVRRLEEWLGGLSDRVVAVWGLTYKPGTSTLRRSAALMIIAELRRKGARVRAYDPRADRSELEGADFAVADDPLEACEGADALLIVTGWPQFREVDFGQVARRLRGKRVFDCANLLDPEQLARAGLQWRGIGVGRVSREGEDHA